MNLLVKKYQSISVLFLGLILAFGVVQARDGDLDTTFSGDGVGDTAFLKNAFARDVAVQNDGKIVIGGSASDISLDNEDRDFAIARYNADGTLDRTFSGDGKVTIDFGADDHASSVAIDGTGKILVAGFRHTPDIGYEVALARLNANGALDTTFSGDGKEICEFVSFATDIVLLEQGKFAITASNYWEDFALLRFNSNGSLDTTFGTEGMSLADFGYEDTPYSLVRQKDGKFVVAGPLIDMSDPYQATYFGLARFTADGVLDRSFSGDGKLAIEFGQQATAFVVEQQNDGKLVVGGKSFANGHNSFGVVRLNSDGSLDNSFSGDGKATISIFGSEEVHDLIIQSDGRIVLGGITEVVRSAEPPYSIDYDFALARLNSNGSLDASFGNGGVTTTDLGGDEQMSALAQQADGRLIAVGGFREATVPSPPGATLIIRYANAAQPRLTINDARTFAEGSSGTPGATTFTVSLNAPSTATIKVNYQTADGTAKAGQDYTAKSGTLTFNPGETTKYVRVNFIGDSVAEPNETFFVDLKTPVNAPVADSRGKAFIGNDDGPGITIDNATSVTEGNTGTKNQTFVVRLSAASTNTVTVDWATGNGPTTGGAGPADFVVANGTLSFAPGQTSKTITIQVKGDTTVEPNEKYFVNLSRPTFAIIADSQGSGFILNDDTAGGIVATNEPSR